MRLFEVIYLWINCIYKLDIDSFLPNLVRAGYAKNDISREKHITLIGAHSLLLRAMIFGSCLSTQSNDVIK